MGMNQVEVNESAIASEVDRILSDVPADAPAISPAGEAPELERELTIEEIQAAAAHYQGGAYMILRKAADVFAPAWAISNDECKGFSDTVAFAMAAWFPDLSLPPKWLALINVGGGLYSLIDSRRDPETGKLKPLRHEPKEAAASPPREAA